MIEQAKTNQSILKNFYSVINDSDPYLQFMLITGVSKFSKVSLLLSHRFCGVMVVPGKHYDPDAFSMQIAS